MKTRATALDTDPDRIPSCTPHSPVTPLSGPNAMSQVQGCQFSCDLPVHFARRIFPINALSPESQLAELRNYRRAGSKEKTELEQILVDGDDFIDEKVANATDGRRRIRH